MGNSDQHRPCLPRRLANLENTWGRSTKTLFLPMKVRRPAALHSARPLRGCIGQTVIPRVEDFNVGDLTLSGGPIRRRHRNHLSAALAAVKGMLALRKTHMASDGRLDWLILPELAVHPRDVATHLIPFARAHRTLILTGVTYERLLQGQPLVNSALWIIPEWSAAHGRPQASIAFFEIDDIAHFLKRGDEIDPNNSTSKWKYPPAGLKRPSAGDEP